MNGNGKVPSADALFSHEIGEDEDDLGLAGEAVQFDGDDELLPAGLSAAISPLESALEELEPARDSHTASPASVGPAALEDDREPAGSDERPAKSVSRRNPSASGNDEGGSEPRTADAVKRAQGVERPQPRRRWLAGVLSVAFLAFAGGLAYWLWSFGDLTSALALFKSSKPEIAATKSELVAPQSLPGNLPTDELGGQPTATGGQPAAAGGHPTATGGQPTATGGQPAAAGGHPTAAGEHPTATGGQPPAAGEQPAAAGEQPAAAGEQPAATGGQPTATGDNRKAIQQSGTADESGALPVKGLLREDAYPVQGVLGYQQEIAIPAEFSERLEGIESLLTRLNERLNLMEANQRELVQKSESSSAEAQLVKNTSVDVASDGQSGLQDATDPVRSEIAECSAKERAVVDSLGAMQMAVREGADGQRWIRILGRHWRRDLISGDLLPLGNPAEARLWVDGAGVFGVVSLPGDAPCRIEWE